MSFCIGGIMDFDENLSSRLDEWIEAHKEELLNDISSVVAIRSVSEKEADGYPYGKGCHDVLLEAERIASGYGFECNNPEDRYLLVRFGRNGGKKIGVFNHMDVVPEGTGWEHEPYRCVLENGFLVGRGVADNKGAGMASLYALRFLSEQGICLSHDVELYYGAAEETGMEDVEIYLQHNEAPYFSLVPDSNFPVCYGEKGNLRFDLSVRLPSDSRIISLEAGEVVNSVPNTATAVLDGGVSVHYYPGTTVNRNDGKVVVTAHGAAGHAAFPELSDNAVRILLECLSLAEGLDEASCHAVKALLKAVSGYYGEGLGAEEEDEASGKLTVVGTVLRMKEGLVTLSFDSRTPVTVDGNRVEEKYKAFAASNGLEYTGISWSRPAYTPVDSPEVQLLCSVAEYVHKRKLTPYTMGGGTYSRKLPFAVGFGPGLPDAPNLYPQGKGNGHQSDECILFELILKDIKADVLALIGLDKIIG